MAKNEFAFRSLLRRNSIQFAMVLIGARSRYHVDDRAAAIAELGAEIGLLDFELLNRVHRRNVQRLLNAGIVVAVHDADAIQQQVGLGVAAAVGYEIGDESGSAHAVAVGAAGRLRDARTRGTRDRTDCDSPAEGR